MTRITLIICFAFLLDLMIGDPQSPLHPIRAVGNYIYFWIRKFNDAKINSNKVKFILGILLSLSAISLFSGIALILIIYTNKSNTYIGFITEVILCYFIIAPKSLKTESMKVYKSIINNDIEDARIKLSYIVGRDTKQLDFKQITVATVETIAENFSDGVIAPLLFVFIGGVPFGIAYKVVNTLDSMVGYRNETFEYFGKFSAILDDIVNFIPARISALCIVVATLFTKYNTRNVLNIYIRDRKNHKSPNSAQTESVFAGALGVKLGGDNFYKGILVHKPTIGDDINIPEPKDIIRANNLMYFSTIIFIIFMIIFSLLF